MMSIFAMSVLLRTGKRDRRAKPAAVCVFRLYTAVHPLRRFFHNGKSDTTAACGILPRGIGAVTELENFLQLRIIHTGTVI